MHHLGRPSPAGVQIAVRMADTISGAYVMRLIFQAGEECINRIGPGKRVNGKSGKAETTIF